MKNLFRLSLSAMACMGILTGVEALANVTCVPTAGLRAGLTCQNDSPDGTTITVRHIPAWGANAGVVFVDMCPSEIVPMKVDLTQVTQVRKEGDVLVAQLQGKDVVPANVPRSCVRRICSDAISEFAIRVQATPIPIGFDLFLGVIVGFKNSQFEVVCKTLSADLGGAP